MSRSTVIYRSRGDATAEGEANALAQIYKFVLEKQRAAERAAQNDGKE